MANEFAGFLNYLATTGVTQAMPDLARRCRDIHLKLPSFADRGIQESDDQYSNTSPDSRKSVSPNSDQLQQPSESSLSTQTTFALPYFPDPLVQSNQQAPLFGQNFTAWNPDSYEILAKPTAENASFPVYSDPVMPQQASASASYLCPSLPAPTSYASQELSFGRRLQRTSLEAGLSLVGMASPSPDRYAAVFGFCLLFESKLDIAARLSRCLQATAEENLCAWQFPFHTLGGAGLNYTDSAKGAADSGSDGGGARPNHQAMGPFTATVEDARDKFLDRGLSVRYEDFKGNFLDPAEVEIYLRRRGVEVPVNSDFVDVEVNPRHFADDAVHLDENLWQQPDQTPPTHASAAQEPSMGSLGPQLFTDGTSSGAPDVSSPNLFYCPAIPVDWWTPRGSVKATLNVNLFLESK
jgi:hypothetical protein